MRKIYIILVLPLIALMACRKDQTKTTTEPCEPVIITYDNYEGYWVILYKESVKDGQVVKEYQDSSDSRYPIALQIFSNDSLYGRHDVNWYLAYFTISGRNTISLSGLRTTDVHTGAWYADFYYKLSEMSRFEVRNEETLRLFNDPQTFSIYLIRKEKFEREFYDLDILYP